MEAWRRALNDPVSAFPIAKAGPAHIATLKTFDPPLAALEGRKLLGAERRGKRLLFPTEDGELVLLVHLMTSGRLKLLAAGESGPKTPAFALEFLGGSKLVLTEAAKRKRAGVWLLTPEAAAAELEHLGPEALGLGPAELGEIMRRESRRLHPYLRNQHAIAGIGRAWANEILHAAKLSPYALSTDLATRRSSGSRPPWTKSYAAGSRCAKQARRTSERTASTTGSGSPATSAAPRSPRSISRSTRSITAPPARPRAGSSRIAAFHACSDNDLTTALHSGP